MTRLGSVALLALYAGACANAAGPPPTTAPSQPPAAAPPPEPTATEPPPPERKAGSRWDDLSWEDLRRGAIPDPPAHTTARRGSRPSRSLGFGPGPMGSHATGEVESLAESAPELYFPPRLVLRFSTRLELTPDQQRKIRLAMLAARRDVLAQRTRAEGAWISVQEIAASEHPDLDAMYEHLDAIAAARAEIAKLHLRLWQRTRDALTPEQRAVFVELRARGRDGFGRLRRHAPPKL